MLALHRGQGRELLWRDHLQCPTEKEYIEMVKDSKYLAVAERSELPTHPMLRNRRTAANRSEIDDRVRHHKQWDVCYTSRKAS